MSWLDYLVVLIYFVSIAWATKSAMNLLKRLPKEKRSQVLEEEQFLAGKTATVPEAVLSIAATEFSAFTFVQLPALVMLGRRGLIWAVIGMAIGRWAVSRFLLKDFYRNGLTVFETLSRGIKNYHSPSPSAWRGRRFLALVYFFTKILTVSAAMHIGVYYTSRFCQLPYELVLFVIVGITATYTILGGLKAVMRTDMVQFAFIFIGGGCISLNLFFREGPSVVQVFERLSIASFGTSGIIPFLAGIASGFVADFSSHGIEQDFVQKLKSCRHPTMASKAVIISSVVSVTLQFLFLLLGAIIAARATLPRGTGLTGAIDIYMHNALETLGPGWHGLVVAAMIAATMSTLDSSLNALSAVLWNDILPSTNSKMLRHLVKFDNAVVAIFVAMFAFFVSQNPIYIKGFMTFHKMVMLPLVCCFILRFLMYPRISFGFGLHSVMFVTMGCIVGQTINSFYLDFPTEIGVFFCLAIGAATLWMYERLKAWI